MFGRLFLKCNNAIVLESSSSLYASVFGDYWKYFNSLCCASHSLSFAVKLLKPALSIISFRHIFWIARFKMFRFVNYAALRGWYQPSKLSAKLWDHMSAKVFDLLNCCVWTFHFWEPLLFFPLYWKHFKCQPAPVTVVCIHCHWCKLMPQVSAILFCHII